MKFNGLLVLSTLALSTLARSVGEAEAATAIGQALNAGARFRGIVIGNGTAVPDDDKDEGKDEDKDDDKKNDDDKKDDDNKERLGDLIDGLGDSLKGIEIDPKDVRGSLAQSILDLMLAMGICNFNLGSLRGLNVGNEIQLLLQLQQLQQLQALGLINPFAVDQLIQREILSKSFNLDIIRRSIDATVKQAGRGRKRTAVVKQQCANAGQGQKLNQGQEE
ncbi:hypothetical protein F4808DRAFT_175622 [Astrocystis sublimbata]|nr:hypothetical protein F4808DRAFT_175622 [Astrocystis sublimbata]